MDFIYTYEKGYKADRGKRLSNDEKAFLEGYNYAIHNLKNCLDFYEDDDEVYSDIKPVKEIQEDLKNKLCTQFSLWLQSTWCECLIDFMDCRIDKEEVVSDTSWRWNTEGYEVEEPEDLNKEDEDEEE